METYSANSGEGFMSTEIVLSIFTREYVSQSAMSMYQVILIQYHPSVTMKERAAYLSQQLTLIWEDIGE